MISNNQGRSFGADGFNFLAKGFKYFQKEGGSLEKLHFCKLLNGYSTETFYQIMRCVPDLQVINLKDNSITITDAKALGRVLSDFKNIKELDLSNTEIGTA